MEADKELWKDIEGYEGLYKVSSYGNVLSLKYCGSNRKHLLAPNTDHKGYLMVYLSKRGKTKTFKIHRLVASAFIPNPHNLPIINHKDENPSNNSVENLEWCTHKYNMNYRNRPFIGRAKCIKQIDENGNIVGRFRSISEASRNTGISRGNISSVLNGGKYRHNAGNHKWEFDYETVFE